MKIKLPPEGSSLWDHIDADDAQMVSSERRRSLVGLEEAAALGEELVRSDPYTMSCTMYAKNNSGEMVLVKVSRLSDLKILWNFDR